MYRTFKSINPFDQSIIAEHALMSEQQLQQALQLSGHAFESWKKTGFEARNQLVQHIAAQLRLNKEKFARSISLEMGKILSESRIEIEKCAVTCEYYARHGKEYMKDESITIDAKKALIAFQPIGAIFGIMPWNFPFWQVIRAAMPTILAGNVFLLKHAPNVSMCSKEIETLFLEAGFPQGVFQSLIVDIDVTEKIISHEIVQGVTLTGSEFAGSSVAALAGKHIKKSVLELGGSDPLIVLDDADFESAAKVALQSRMQNAGQSCIASKRFIVLEKGRDEFVQKLFDGVKKLKQGNQLEETTTTGPMARVDLSEKLETQQKNSVKNGARILIGGNRDQANFQPTILTDVQPGIPAFDEEMFGPVAAIISVKDEADAIRLANKNRYGLGASIWTRDLERGERIAREINSGAVFINALVKSDARYPFGGVKKSGYGRELGKYGMHEFVNAKTIYIDQ
ncbi:MAG: NAD-dependent succinate-semialdehyde dehydrogenase [Chitinophagaceae bacterium]|nr:NAD-dependent succinate-semialdehyde dehydrogenase [Chitinophagaceae bacterium]